MRPLTAILEIQSSALAIDSLPALQAHIATATREAVAYSHAVVFAVQPSGRAVVAAASDLPSIDPSSPEITAFNAIGDAMASTIKADTSPHIIQGQDGAFTLTQPLRDRHGNLLAILYLTRDVPFTETDIYVIERLSGVYAYAYATLSPFRRQLIPSRFRRLLRFVLPGAAAAGLLVPVSQTALAPAEISGASPITITAPLDGVINRIAIRANTPVRKGDALFSFDVTILAAQADSATRELAVAQAALRQSTQGAMMDAKAAARLAQDEATVRLKESDLAYAKALLARATVVAPADGVAVFADENDWTGRPVQTGQRVMQIIDPSRPEVRINLPAKDAITLAPGSAVALFLDTAPLSPLSGRVLAAAYEPEVTAAGILSYRVRASLDAAAVTPRVGLTGTAKLYGDRVSLASYLFRRPLAALRQTLGL